MADIDVTFASNAGTVARDIDRAAASTGKAGAAAAKHTAAVKPQSAELAKSTAAMKAATREAERLEKQNLALAKSEEAKRRATIGKAAGAGGLGRGFAGASVAGSALSGAAGGIAGLGILAAGSAVSLLTYGITKASDELEKMVKAGYDWRDMVKKASEAQGKAGQDAIKEFGSTLTDLVSRGGGLKDFADEIAKAGHPLAEAQKAVLDANRMFPGHERSAVAIGNDASRITGQPLSKSVSNLEGMPASTLENPLAAVSALVSMSRGVLTSNDDTLNARDNIESNPYSRSMLMHGRLSAKSDLSNQENILNAPTAAATQLNAVVAPLMNEVGKQNELLQRQIDIAQKVYEGQNGLVSVIDRLVRGKDSAAGKLRTAQENMSLSTGMPTP